MPGMGDTFIISGLREKRSAVAGRIVDLGREIEKLKGDRKRNDEVNQDRERSDPTTQPSE